ncbi:uncharacterized protein SAPINGB_P001109 [Magnusiomyces paraingens]|uniref:Protein DML1 n=1 Tax=Magnusiomyces paraingens TaxID=2606893 RepID=A0A5E8B428_9ASCO|nr:uncharacterized protein SAPINGB_P001109 [Saprochaete ingens]VVT46227.1 unnamed protein product [Saprochaete ingens]
MHEIIHLSHSTQANHLTTHFYNAQNSYFAYNDSDIGTRSFVEPSVLFRQGLGTDHKTQTFTPRAIIWDMRGGFGAMKKSNPIYNYEKVEMNYGVADEFDLWSAESKKLTLDTINKDSTIKQEKIPLSEYQQALDLGRANHSMLNTENTKYWSDYLNIYYNPRLSFHTLPNWEYNPDTAPLGQVRGETGPEARKFLSYDTGVNEFKEVNSMGLDGTYIEDTLRPFIEEADNLSGLSLVSEVDTAWGGFSAKVIEEFRQDYAPKTPLFAWGLYDECLTAELYSFNKGNKYRGGDRKTRIQALSRIQSTIALAKSASLVIPLSIPSKIPEEELKLFDVKSMWHRAAMFMLPFETISTLSSLRTGCGRVSMQNILGDIQGGSNRNIVSSISSSLVQEKEENISNSDDVQKSLDSRLSIYEKFGSMGIIGKNNKKNINYTTMDMTGSLFRGLDDSSSSSVRYFTKVGSIRDVECVQLEKSDTTFDTLFKASELQQLGTSEFSLHQYKCSQPFATSSSVPSFPSNELNMNSPETKNVYTEMGMTSLTRVYMKNCLTTLEKITRSTDEGIDELKEDIATITEAYEWGWTDSDDDFFDDD